ncbi:MAG: M20/M25/M40 family metallo-hydrolase [Chloroflexota bacterium]
MARLRLPAAACALLACTVAMTGCGAATSTPPASGRSLQPVVQFPELGFAVDEGRLGEHLEALMAVAEANDGVRTVGTPGYEASVDYVAGALSELGWRVQTPTVPITTFRETAPARLEVDDATFEGPDEIHALIYSASGDVSGPIEMMSASGCERADFDGFPDGAIAVTSVGGCLRRTQVMNADAAGAVAILMVYPDRGPGEILRPTLISPDGIDIPAAAVTGEAGEALRAADGEEAHLSISTAREPGSLRNVVAELGDGERVVMLGAHLDSVIDGPGINDNGSGVAALLEIARGAAQLGLPDGSTLRLGFWGGEEFGLLGSSAYVDGLTDAQRTAMAAYINLDMVASPNGTTLIYDDHGAPRGSGTITIDYEVWFESRDLPAEREDLGGASDHHWFEQVGIPTGGLFAGANETVTAEQGERFGATRNEPMDACYHLPCDDAANVDLARAATFADATLAVALRLLEAD